MPHITVEYSANVEAQLSIDDLLKAVHEAALASGLFNVGGVRTRAARRESYLVAEGAPENGFVYVLARIAVGRSREGRQALANAIFDAASGCLEPAFATMPLALHIQIEEADPDFSCRRNNIHDRLRSDQ